MTIRVGYRATLVASAVAAVALAAVGGFTTHAPARAATVSEEFDGPAGAAPNSSIWTYDVGGGGWGNGEQQVYTNARANSRLDGKGRLIIEARRDGDTITSARLTTRGKFTFTVGLLEARIATPQGTGLHPAFWLLGADIGSVGYPASGEIDIMEFINDGAKWHTALHGPTTTGGHWQQSRTGPFADQSDDFHVYGVYRAPGVIAMLIDGKVVSAFTPLSVPADARWVFDKPMYVLLNLAVGGQWPGPVGAATDFPSRMVVDWVRYHS
ncbi:glycoside hydrolase family 16 protein [Gordonia sp. ABSL1-1]|uniref:glycoside hydrolase family 16 protein n=1 Tax=Gordonia sp. ABSL1-1 TaxID=3053923 RepID=UPI002574811D|nr:glycoside hydrolase family 16 protein [Gordonia sp. ABSL1-1]MDL9936070.1 glycoside hydrolase family 16 protein [Gordonia sp. ABSL1-1]